MDSILAQTYHNIEVLLINDGSTDTSGAMCQEYVEAYSRIRYFEKENGGLSDAHNVDIEKAAGDYIIFVDSDDWIPENHVEFLYQKLQEQDADIAIGNLMGFRQEDYNFLIYFSEEDYFEKVYTREEIQEEFTIKYNIALCMTTP